jgi:hypothetical protein
LWVGTWPNVREYTHGHLLPSCGLFLTRVEKQQILFAFSGKLFENLLLFFQNLLTKRDEKFCESFLKIENAKTERPLYALYTVAADPMFSPSLIITNNVII